MLPLERGLDFSGSWEQTSTTNRSKNGTQDGMHLGIDLLAISVNFWSHVGKQNRAKIDRKSIQKGIEKKMRKGRARNSEKWSRRSAIRLGVGSAWARRGLGVGSAPAGTRARRRWGEGREGGTGKKTCICDLTRRRPEARQIFRYDFHICLTDFP